MAGLKACRWSRDRIRLAGWLCAALAASVMRVSAEPAAVTSVASPATASLSDRARLVLEAHCAACKTRHADGGTLDLSALAADVSLIVARRPDASRVYQDLLTAQTAAIANVTSDAKSENAALRAPSPEDIEAVRDWIESLPARDAGCAGRTPIGAKDVEMLVDRWLAAVGPAEASDTRFVSLAHLWNACTDAQGLAADRAAAGILLAALARRRDPLATETLGDESALLVVRLSALAIVPSEWDRLVAAAPSAPEAEAVPADWLAARVLSNPDETGNRDPILDVRFDGAGLVAVTRLEEGWNADVDLVRAAAERGVRPQTLARQLAELGDDHLRAAMRLTHASVTRSAWTNLTRALDGTAPAPTPWKRVVTDDQIDVLLWTDKPVYRPRDLVTAHVTVSRACHLTLMSVDRDGKAIVLFPNELEQDNLVPPGTKVTVPGHDAGYQLRFERAGEEQLVAACARGARRHVGIAYDYERQRFAILGDWRSFLRTLPEREKDIRAAETSQSTRRRRRGRAPVPSEPPPIAKEETAVGRAAITVVIEPAGKS